MTTKPLIFCALDTANLQHAEELARTVGPVTGALKLGMEFVNGFGPEGIKAVQKVCPKAGIFIDLKFHDIPNTVAGAIETACRLHTPAFINVHALGGRAMMDAAKNAKDKIAAQKTKLLAVTILTSMDEEALNQTGQRGPIQDQVVRLAKLAQASGLDGVVCSAHEIEILRKECGQDFILMVPGIRPAGEHTQDQKRVMTPKQALQKGATHLVIGRPITENPNPAAAAQAILDEISA